MQPENPVLQVVAQTKDANPRGDMFGGWIMGLMDLAGTIPVAKAFANQLATAAVNHMRFLKPILVGAHVAVSAEISRVGNTSVTVEITVYAAYANSLSQYEKVADAELIYVAISDVGKPTRLVQKTTAPPLSEIST